MLFDEVYSYKRNDIVEYMVELIQRSKYFRLDYQSNSESH